MSVTDGNAIVYCDGFFNTPSGKTAHGLVRHTRRYRVLSVIDRAHAGRDAREVLDGKASGIPVVPDLDAAIADARARGITPSHFVIGLAPDGGRLPDAARACVRAALEAGLNVDSGLHDFLSDDPALVALAAEKGLTIRDVRKTPGRAELHGFSGRIEGVGSFRIALLGTDSAVGKRTTAWLVVDELRRRGLTAELIGTGQTAWLQGARHGIILDSLINDFVSGELEHAIVSCWEELQPQFMVIEGQGSLMNPAYPGGFEILAAGRPHVVVMQHAPARREYDGFPGYVLHDIGRQIEAVELLSDRPVVGITVNHEGLDTEEAILAACRELEVATGLPAEDPLVHGVRRVVDEILVQRSALTGSDPGQAVTSLRITAFNVTRLPMTLSEPYAIASQSFDRFENLLVEVATTGGLVGLGVAAPDLEVTGESVDGTETALRGVVEPLLRGEDGASRARLIEAVRDALPQAPSVRAAVDLALVDLVAKAAGVPAWRMLGGQRTRFATSVTVGILPLAETLAAIARRVAEGFAIIKLKGGADVEEDIARVHAIRQRFGPALELRFDANCGYGIDAALHFAAATADVGITIYEQPVKREALHSLGHVALATGMSVMADESLMSARDCFRLGQKVGGGEQTLVDMINIKLMKVGGVEDAMQVNAVARAAAIESMVGCMDECELAIAGSLAFALSRRNVTAVDLDGHFDVLGDPTAGRCVRLERGVLIPSDAPGFGLEAI